MFIKKNNEKYLRNDGIYKKFYSYERLKFCIKEVEKFKPNYILDLGCSVGQLIYLLQKRGYIGNYLGVDNDLNSIKIAKKNLNNLSKKVIFKHSNLENFKTNNRFDLITIWGVLGYFDDYETILNKYIKMMKTKSSFSIFHVFNESPYDTVFRIKYRKKLINPGYNFFSLKNILNFFKKKKFNVKISKFLLKRHIRKNKTKPLNQYTWGKGNKKLILNQLNLNFTYYHIIATKIDK